MKLEGRSNPSRIICNRTPSITLQLRPVTLVSPPIVQGFLQYQPQDVSPSILDSRHMSHFTRLRRTDREPSCKFFCICLRSNVGFCHRFQRLSQLTTLPVKLQYQRLSRNILSVLEPFTRPSPTGHHQRLRRCLPDRRLRNKGDIATRRCQKQARSYTCHHPRILSLHCCRRCWIAHHDVLEYGDSFAIVVESCVSSTTEVFVDVFGAFIIDSTIFVGSLYAFIIDSENFVDVFDAFIIDSKVFVDVFGAFIIDNIIFVDSFCAFIINSTIFIDDFCAFIIDSTIFVGGLYAFIIDSKIFVNGFGAFVNDSNDASGLDDYVCSFSMTKALRRLVDNHFSRATSSCFSNGQFASSLAPLQLCGPSLTANANCIFSLYVYCPTLAFPWNTIPQMSYLGLKWMMNNT